MHSTVRVIKKIVKTLGMSDDSSLPDIADLLQHDSYEVQTRVTKRPEQLKRCYKATMRMIILLTIHIRDLKQHDRSGPISEVLLQVHSFTNQVFRTILTRCMQ